MEKGAAYMSWADLEWPEVPDLPVPLPDQLPPALPALPAGGKVTVLALEEKARNRRRFRGWMLFCLVWLGILGLGSLIVPHLPPPHPDAGDWQGILFLAGGFTLGLLVLLILIRFEQPTAAERAQRDAYLAWQMEYETWLAMARQAYQEQLAAEQQARLVAALAASRAIPTTWEGGAPWDSSL
jgi:hypothetical protein